MFGRGTKPAGMRKAAVSCLLIGSMAICLIPQAYGQKKKKDKRKEQETVAPKPQIDTSKLVWPSPPDVARIRWVSSLEGEPPKAEAPTTSKKKKHSWMDRIAGVQEEAPKTDVRFRLVQPYGVAVDSKGRIYAADSYVGAIFVFDLNKEVSQTGGQDLNPVSMIANGKDARFRGLVGVAVDDNDRLFAVDVLLRTIPVFGPDHKFETSFGSEVLGQPNCAAIDTENRFLYVTDAAKNNVAVFDADSYKLLRTIGGPPKKEGDDEPGTFARPTYVAVDHEGNVYVSDTINNRIQIFDADGQFISTFGRAGDRPGFFSRPKGVAVDGDGHSWVVDAVQDNVQIYDRSGQLLAFFGERGPFPGEFILPTGLTIDKQNRVIVAEQHFPGRLQVFRYVTDAEAAAEKNKEGKCEEKPAAKSGDQAANSAGEGPR